MDLFGVSRLRAPARISFKNELNELWLADAARTTAEERVISFLTDMAQRALQERMIDLPMSRWDIADYLGLTTETVSRVLRDFERRGAIKIKGYRFIALRNHFANGRGKLL